MAPPVSLAVLSGVFEQQLLSECGVKITVVSEIGRRLSHLLSSPDSALHGGTLGCSCERPTLWHETWAADGGESIIH